MSAPSVTDRIRTLVGARTGLWGGGVRVRNARHADRRRPLNVRRLPELGAGVASIGGAGTFDGVFRSGIMGVVLVGVS